MDGDLWIFRRALEDNQNIMLFSAHLENTDCIHFREVRHFYAKKGSFSLVGFYDTSNIEGYLIPNPVYTYHI